MNTIHILAVDDQDIAYEALKALVDKDKNLSLSFCKDPLRAVQMAKEVKPSVILLDLIMPEIDGLLVLRYLKDDPGTKEIPVIVLSVKEDQEVKSQAFLLGAVDYLVKYPGVLEFSARLHYHANNYLALQTSKRMHVIIETDKKRLEEELQTAATYLESLLPRPFKNDISCDWRYIPSASIGGDSFGYRLVDNDYFIFYLYDVSGHGMRAAMHSNILQFAIQGLDRAGIDIYEPKQVLHSLNAEYQMDRCNNTFFSMWYGVFDIKARVLTYASGGHPPAVAFMPLTHKKEELLYTHGMALGVDPQSVYEEFAIEVPYDSRLFLFSDGIFETTASNGKIMTFEQFMAILKQPPFPNVSELDRIIHNTEIFRQGHPFDDDVCILQIDF